MTPLFGLAGTDCERIGDGALAQPVNTLSTAMGIELRSGSLIAEGEQFYGHSVGPYFADVLSTEERFENLVENQRETIEMLHHTNESLLSSRISNIMAVLTVFSAIVLPLNLIASIWGMNQQIMPLRDGRYDFWIVVGIMAVLLFVLVLFFKKKRWL